MRLRGFLHSCAAKGLSTVLVAITGKGGPAAAGDAPHDHLETGSRGVLKRSVPLWLEEPDLRALVISYRTAHVRHGGEGALYVHLRKRSH